MSKDKGPISQTLEAAAKSHPPAIQVATQALSDLAHPQGQGSNQGEIARLSVFLVMATARVYDHKQPIPLRVFYDRAQADGWLERLIDCAASTELD